MRVKTVVPYLRKYIPGNPTIVVEFIEGGGGRRAANHVFRTANPDGLTVGALSSSVIGLNVMRETGVMYDIDKFIYLGTPVSENHNVIYTRRELGLNTLEKLRAASGIRIGAQEVGAVAYISARLFAYFLDLKAPKFVTGYSSLEADVALTNGEIDSRANNTTSVLRRNREWVEKGIMDFHAILAVPKAEKHPHPRFAQLPEIEGFAKTEKEKSCCRCGAASERQHRLSCYHRERPKTGWRFCKMRCARYLTTRSFARNFRSSSATMFPVDAGRIGESHPRNAARSRGH